MRSKKLEVASAAILAGGQNRRFLGEAKAFINIEGMPIIERNLNLMKELFDEVLISTNMPERYFYLGVPLIGDVISSEGPMSGIYSALLNAKSECIFVTACDMPFIKKELISFVCSRHSRADAVIPVYNNEPQPLFGVYCKSTLPYLEEGILNKKTTLKRFLFEIETLYISEADIRKIDPQGMSFVNINTPEDYERILNNNMRSKDVKNVD